MVDSDNGDSLEVNVDEEVSIGKGREEEGVGNMSC